MVNVPPGGEIPRTARSCRLSWYVIDGDDDGDGDDDDDDDDDDNNVWRW